MDAKLQDVLLDYGLEGYGLYWYCIELIAAKVDQNNLIFDLEHDARIIARNTGSTTQKIEEMMKRFIDIGLFEASDGLITCLKLAKRTDEYTAKLVRATAKTPDKVRTNSGQSPDSLLTKSALLDKNRLDKNIKETMSSGDDAPKVKQVPYEAIKDIYNDQLPTLTGSRVLSDKSKRQIAAIWKQDAKHQHREFWTAYFSGCGQLIGKMENWTGASTGNKCGTIELLTRNEIFVRNINEIIDAGIWA
jgi:hypothetical protein